MRITRCERNRNRNTLRRMVLALFLIIVPLTAVASSMFFIDIYNKRSGMEAATDGLASNNVVAFKYNYEIGSKTLYRIELKSSKSLSEMEDYIKGIKSKKLNGFILKEDGYKVIYGTFSEINEADKVKRSIAGKAECSISETKLPSFNLKYNENDNTFIQLIQAADKLIWEVAGAKSLLSHEIALESNYDTAPVLQKIEDSELKLERYLGYAEKIAVSKEQESFKDSFVLLLKEVLDHKLVYEKDYYLIQGSLMNQIEAYRRFAEKLSI